MDESRKQFEESWLRRGGDSSDLIRYPENHHEIGSGNIGGQYVIEDIQGHWQTWTASRAAIEVETISHYKAVNAIPSSETSIIDAVKIGYLMCAGVAGIKVKG